MTFTVAYITSRFEPEFHWLYDSVRRESDCPVIVIAQENFPVNPPLENVAFHDPKPTVWSGPHRLTKQAWWSKSNSLNSAICLCRTDWLMFCDDRSVLMPGWFARVKAAMDGNYAVCGKYEKTHDLIVTGGIVKSYVEPVDDKGNKTGKDTRAKYVREHWNGASPVICPGEWWFGCLNAMPLEWALQINGYEELMDGLSFEDVICGLMLKNNGFTIKYDSELALIEDRTPGKLGPAMRRTSKERFPHDKEDKGHKALARFGIRKRTEHHWDLRAIRDAVLRGEPFPPATHPTRDWFDNQAISEM